MVKIKPFAGIRPPKELAAEVSSRPYDVLNSQEAKAEATERSLLHIIKPEIDFDPIADEHDEKVYKKAVENFKKWRDNKWLVQDGEEHYYIYAQTMNGRTQYGLAMCCYYEDYWSGKIKKHELTRIEKEEDRMKHVELQQANLEPVFFAYPDNDEINKIVADYVKNNKADYDFTAAPEGFGHHFWVIRDKKINDRITEIFAGIPALYVADGHHRTAAAARVGKKRQESNPNHTGNEESPLKIVRISGITQITANQRCCERTDIHSHIENGVCSIQTSVTRLIKLSDQRRNGRFETTISQDQESESAIHQPVCKVRIIQCGSTHKHQELSDSHHHRSPEHGTTDSPIFISDISANQRGQINQSGITTVDRCRCLLIEKQCLRQEENKNRTHSVITETFRRACRENQIKAFRMPFQCTHEFMCLVVYGVQRYEKVV